jgi:4-hydroxy-tetrahydrodipicolinate synthase
MSSKFFDGVRKTITALVTPFERGNVDYDSLGRLVQHQLENGINGFVVHGTTGESPTVTSQERKDVFKFIQSKVPKDFLLIAGTGSNSTSITIEATQEAKSWGAQAALVVVPYYNKPPQRGLIQHFQKVSAEGGLPVILYNVPGRTITSLSLDSIVRLAEDPNIIGIKEATGDIELAKSIREKIKRKFLLLSGDDGTYEKFLAVGGDGVISVGSHVLPREFVAGSVNSHLPLIDALFLEANPIPVKKVLQFMGILKSAELRLPLVEMSEEHAPILRELLQARGLVR